MGYNILIIDDTQSVRNQILVTLRSVELFSDYLEAINGVEGLKALLTEKID